VVLLLGCFSSAPNVASRLSLTRDLTMTQPQHSPVFDSPPPRTLSPSSIGALRLWLQSQRRSAMSGRALSGSDVRRAMRLVCCEVKRRGLPVERLLVLLKEQWFTLTEDGDGGSTRARDALEEIIRTCIDEYYASPAGLSDAAPMNRSEVSP
jgi:hypothetical protein